MSEDHLIHHCAPTLAGLKTGSLFTCPFSSRRILLDSLRQINRKLLPKGLRIIPLRFTEDRALIYLYRPKKLSADLKSSAAKQLLQCQGYDTTTCEKCIVQLVQKLRLQKEFPHEIGLFLGYPAEDVLGFMENKACNCKCVGCWKVYGDEAAARIKFDKYKKCTRVYCDQWAKGKDIERLTVAG